MRRTNHGTAPPPPPRNPLPRPRGPRDPGDTPPRGRAASPAAVPLPSPSPTSPVGDPKKTGVTDPLAMMPPPPAPLYSSTPGPPDTDREEAWQRRRDLYRSRRRGAHGRLTRNVTEEDLEELRGCIELGFVFGFGSPTSFSSSSSSTAASPDDADRLSDTLPALDLYYAVHRSCSAGSLAEALPAPAADGSPLAIYSPGESPGQVKLKLKQWAQVVACLMRQHLP